MSKGIKFIPAITLPDGSELATLEDAAVYIQKLSPGDFKKPHWQFAGYEVVAVIEGRSSELFARMAFMRSAGRCRAGVEARPQRALGKT